MIKVMVVLYGMVMFVPVDEMDGKARQLTVIFADGGSHVPDAEHEPVVKAVDDHGNLGPRWPLPDEFEIVVEETHHADGDRWIDLEARADFAPLRDLYTHKDRGYVRSDCMQNDASCEVSGEDPVRGIARFEGHWDTRPADHCAGWTLPIKYADDAEIEFRRSASGRAHEGEPRRPLATALVLETEIQSLAELVVTLDGFPMPLPTLPARTCEEWIKAHDPGHECVILVIGNPTTSYPTCEGTECRRYDTHFSAFYRLTMDPPIRRNRWMPYVVTNPLCPVPAAPEDPSYEEWYEPANPPAVRCPPPFGTAQ